MEQKDIDQFIELSPEQLSNQLENRVSYEIYKSKKSTWSEIKTVIHALQSLQKQFDQRNQKIEIYTDCQSLCDLLGRRKEKLEENNFITSRGSLLQNAELYKELYLITNKFQVIIFKVKGHQAKSNTMVWQEKIFTILDKLSRKKLRSVLKNA